MGVAVQGDGDGRDDGRSVLLVRRHRYTGALSFYRCWTPEPAPLARLIAVAQVRWKSKKITSSPSRLPGWTPVR